MWSDDYWEYFGDKSADKQKHAWVEYTNSEGRWTKGYAMDADEMSGWHESYPLLSDEALGQLDQFMTEDLFGALDDDAVMESAGKDAPTEGAAGKHTKEDEDKGEAKKSEPPAKKAKGSKGAKKAQGARSSSSSSEESPPSESVKKKKGKKSKKAKKG